MTDTRVLKYSSFAYLFNFGCETRTFASVHIRSWNKLVLSDEVKMSYSRKQPHPSTGFKLTMFLSRVRCPTHLATAPLKSPTICVCYC